MPAQLTNLIADTFDQFKATRWDMANAFSHINIAGNALTAGDLPTAGAALNQAYLDGVQVALKLHSRYDFWAFYIIDSLEWIDNNWPGEPEPTSFDMGTLLSVMLAASDDEYKMFIGLVDAYRVGLWDKPFNAEFYAALARGFKG